MGSSDDDGDAIDEQYGSSSTEAFSVLHDKGVAVEVVSLCPKMDLIAILTANGSLLVLRTISWQKLHSVPAADLQDNRVTALAWSPDGNIVALGHERGTISLVDVERGEAPSQPFGSDRLQVAEQSPVILLSWVTQYKDPSTLSSMDAEKERSNEIARYYLDRDGIFLEDLPVLGQQGGSFAAPREKKEEPIGAKLTAGNALDVLVTCYGNGAVLLLASGLFPLISFKLQDLIPGPSSGLLRIQSAACTPDLATLLLAVEQGEGGKDGSTLMALHLPILWSNRHQLKAITCEFSAISSLMAHLQEALDLAARHWKDGLRTLDIKLGLFNTLLRDYACQATAREAFLTLVLSGVACPALSQYLSQNCSEPQQHNMFRLSKTVDDKCANVEGLLREQVGRVAEMIVFRASKLRGMARIGADFQEVGLDPTTLSGLLEAAVRLSLKAEEALREVQQARQCLKVFLLWLLDTMQHQAGGRATKLTFRNSTKHIRMLLSFLRKPPTPAVPMTNTESIIAVQVSSYFKDEPLSVPFPSTSIPDLGSVSLRTQTKRVRAQFDTVFGRPLETLKARSPPCRFLRLTSNSVPCPDLYASSSKSPSGGPVIVAVAHPERALVLSFEINEQEWEKSIDGFFPLQTVSLSPPASKTIQKAALYGQGPLTPSSNSDALVLLVRGSSTLGDTGFPPPVTLCKIPLESLDLSTIPSHVLSTAPSIMDVLMGQTAGVVNVASIDGFKGRELVQGAARELSLTVTGSRGVAVVSSRANQLLLVDMEEDDEAEEEDGEEGGGEQGGMDIDDEEKS